MPDKPNSGTPTARPVQVGTRVRVRRATEAAPAGVIIEDYADLTRTGEPGHRWAPVHRWAVALDDGRLVFVDTGDLEIEPENSAPDPGR